jgi:hypothetical protein
MNVKDRLLAQAALLADAQEEVLPVLDGALVRSDLEGRARFYASLVTLGAMMATEAADVVAAPCWQCEKPLGTTEVCLTCAAKRAEDRVRGKT